MTVHADRLEPLFLAGSDGDAVWLCSVPLSLRMVRKSGGAWPLA